ncbi:MAG: PASTA domain-containing protein [Oscillospiraceae bacterium]|nr:PASTA domain-containing protein [Oscillospiraceae bacterium]
MSDFLNQFSKDSYKRALIETPIVKTEPERQDIGIQGPVHDVEVDKTFHRARLIKYLLIVIAVIAVCVTGFLLYRSANRVEIKPLVGLNLSEARSWALRNRVELNISYVFDLENDQDIIIEQSPASGGRIQRGSLLDIVVSNGPDPHEILLLPDFSVMTTAQIRDWRTEYKVNNANIVQEYSNTVEQGRFLRLEFPSDMVNESNYTRSDMMVIVMSRGEEEVLRDITVPNFGGRSREDVESWSEDNRIRVTFEEEPSQDIQKDHVVSQSIAAGERIAADYEMTVILSMGAGVEVPDFSSISMNDAETYAELDVNVISRYSATIAFGRFVSQSVAAGTRLFSEAERVDVVYSLGQPFIKDLIGSLESELPSYFYEFSANGANITYTKTYIDSSAPRGSIVSATHRSEFVGLTLNVHFTISRGNLAPEVPEEPDFP